MADIETELSVPGEILDRVDICEDVTCELLTLEDDVVEHCHSDRVHTAAESFSCFRSEVSVYVIDRNVWIQGKLMLRF